MDYHINFNMKRFLLAIAFVLGITAISSAQYIQFQNNDVAKGYKGHLDLGYVFDLSDYDAGRLELTTTHGYQFNSYFFAGIGVGVDYYTDLDAIGVPIFADLKITPWNSKTSPFFDAKIGYSVADIEGVYFAPTIGCRFALNDKLGLNVGLGYVLQRATVWYSSGWWWDEATESLSGLSLKVGLDF